jgi:hypothetical protein
VNIKTVLKTSVAAAALVAVAAPAVVSPAEAGLNNGNKNSLVMSGQIARAMIYQDDGNSSQLFHTGGPDTTTRMRWIATGQMTESITIGGLIEMNTPGNGRTISLNGSGSNMETIADTAWGTRHERVTFTHKAAGKLSIGHTGVAGDGTSTATMLSTGPGFTYEGPTTGASEFFDSTAQAASGTQVGSTHGGYDPSRENTIRYDTPSFGGLSLAVSHQDGGQSVGATYSGKFGGVQVFAGGFYYNEASGSTTQNATMGGSVGIKHDSGVSLAANYTKEDVETGVTTEGKNWGVALGYAASLTNLGTTGFGVTYAVSKDTAANNDEGKVWAIGVNQNIAAVGADIYAGYSRASYDDGAAATNHDDFSTIFAGTRLNF